MLSKEFIKQAMRTRGMTQEEFAKVLGYARQTSVSSMLNNEYSTMEVGNLVAMIGELGYDLYAIDRETGQKTKITDKKKKIHARNKTNHVGRPKKGVIHKEAAKEPVAEVKKIPVFQYGK